jgi:hypothetical protein
LVTWYSCIYDIKVLENYVLAFKKGSVSAIQGSSSSSKDFYCCWRDVTTLRLSVLHMKINVCVCTHTHIIVLCLSNISCVLELKEFGSISFFPEQSVSLSIVHVGPYLVSLVCIVPVIEYLFRVSLIFWFLYFDLFQVKVQLVSKWMMDYIIICLLDCWFWCWHEIGFGWNDL